MMKIKIAVVYHSGHGHTERQAQAVARGTARVTGAQTQLLTAGQAAEHIEQLDEADAIVFGSPTYMGNISAEMKKFMELAASRWFTQAWKDKVAGAFTNSSSFSGDKLHTLLGLLINAMQHGMLFVGLGQLPAADAPESMNQLTGPGPAVQNRVGSSVGAMATSFQVDNGPAPGDLESAAAYGERIAKITQQLAQGRHDAVRSTEVEHAQQ